MTCFSCVRVSPGGNAELPEQPDERRALAFRERPRCCIHRPPVAGEEPGRLLPSGRGQPDDAGPAVARVSLPGDEIAGFEAIHRGRDGSAGEPDAPADLVDGLRSYVEEHLHDTKIRKAHFEE